MHNHERCYQQEYLAWYNRVNSPGEHFDPTSLVKLARRQWSNRRDLADSFARCTRQWPRNELYTYFINPYTPDKPGCRWDFAMNLMLSCPERGVLVVDIMKDCSIGGIEFLDRVMGHPVDLGQIDGVFCCAQCDVGCELI